MAGTVQDVQQFATQTRSLFQTLQDNFNSLFTRNASGRYNLLVDNMAMGGSDITNVADLKFKD